MQDIRIELLYQDVNAEQYGYKIISFEQYNGEHLIVSTEKYYDEIKQQLRDKKLIEYRDFCSMAVIRENIGRTLWEELKKEIKNERHEGERIYCF